MKDAHLYAGRTTAARASLAELEAVQAIGAARSFRGAARRLDVSPSALSHAVSALEQRLGVRLFQRTTRSVALSPAGERFVSRLAPALAEISSALDDVREQRETPSGTLRFTTSRGAGAPLLVPLLTTMRERHPEVQIEIVADERFVDLVAEGFDAGFRLAEAVPQDMVAIPCGPPDLAMAIVGAPSYFANHPIPRSPADLRAHECIRRRLTNGSIYRWEVEKRGRVTNVEVHGSLTFNDDALALQAAVAGAGLVMVSAWAAGEHLAAGRLVRVLTEWTPPFPGLRLYHPSGRHVRAALRAFIDIVKESTKRRSRPLR